MDCAKGINFLYSCGGQMQDYWGVGKATADMLPMIAVPTTAGTGSEAQSFALITDATTKRKMACGDRRASCKVALLDPELTLTQPPRITALTGIDALTHALESYVCNKRTPLSLCYSREAWQLLALGFQDVLDRPDDVDARGRVQLGAYFAGLAIETSMLGAAHALANPLTSQFGVVHGQAVGVMMPAVIRFNQSVAGRAYGQLWQVVAQSKLAIESGLISAGKGDQAECLASFFRSLVAKAGLATDLSTLGVSVDSVETLSKDAAKQWTGGFNPRPLGQADWQGLYEQTI
jgi:alcohol dehydrogenase